MMRRFITFLLLPACLLVGSTALAQDEAPAEPPPVEAPTGSLGQQIDAFQALITVLVVFAVEVIGQAAKFILPDTVIDSGQLTTIIRSGATVIYVAFMLAGGTDKLLDGVQFLNGLVEPLRQIVALAVMLLTALGVTWVAPSALYVHAREKRWPVMGARQGPQAMRFGEAA